jgi:hypothetical protein
VQTSVVMVKPGGTGRPRLGHLGEVRALAAEQVRASPAKLPSACCRRRRLVCRPTSSSTEAGGQIVRPIFSFPGGRRFHFTDPAGNELAVWSE